MSLIQVNNVGMSFGGQVLFKAISFNIDLDSRIGLIGRNGCGKTTLLRIINKEKEASSGSVRFATKTKIAYLKQVDTLIPTDSLYESVVKSRGDFIEKKIELQRVRELLSDEPTQENLDILSVLEEDFFTIGGYDYETNIKLILTSLGFKEDVWDTKIVKFSGGEKTRIELAKILLTDYNILLLDEPTNHLDLHMISWLEGYLLNLNKPYIIISHDKLFLDRTINKIFEIDLKVLTSYSGNYSFYSEASILQKEQQAKAFRQQQKHIETTMDFVRRNIGSQKTIQARSRLKQLEKIDVLDDVKQDKRINLKFAAAERTGNDVYVLKDGVLGFPDKVLAKEIDLIAHYQDRIAIIGRNGCGKTTLMKVLMNDINFLSGKCKIGSNIKVGYFDQFHSSLDMNLTPKQTIWNMAPGETIGYVLKYLAKYGFRGDEVDKKIEYMSGGEKARLNLAVLIHQGPNVLLLDEPTNHLDILMVEDLIASLDHYAGTIIFVSHDRSFISQIATKFWLFKNGHVLDIEDEWKYVLEDFLNDNKKTYSQTKRSISATKNTDRKKKVNPYIIDKLSKKMQNTEKRISELESEKAKAEALFAEPSTYGNHELVKELKNKLDELSTGIDKANKRLLILEDEYLLITE